MLSEKKPTSSLDSGLLQNCFNDENDIFYLLKYLMKLPKLSKFYVQINYVNNMELKVLKAENNKIKKKNESYGNN